MKWTMVVPHAMKCTTFFVLVENAMVDTAATPECCACEDFRQEGEVFQGRKLNPFSRASGLHARKQMLGQLRFNELANVGEVFSVTAVAERPHCLLLTLMLVTGA